MENLMLRMRGDYPLYLLVLLASVFLFMVELRQYRASLQAQRTAKKRSARRKHEAEARSARSFLIGIPVIVLVLLLVSGHEIITYQLDSREDPLSAQGTVISTGQQSRGRHLGKLHFVELDTGAEEPLTLYIHKSLVDDYAIKEGAEYAVTYYPRTQTLCEAEKIN